MCPEEQVRVGPEYPFGQLAKAFVTALTHEDAETRERAERRADRWLAVLDGMASGRLAIGSRTPVADLPAWVTPEVIRGGFATGSAAAGIPLEPWERIRAREAGVERTRAGLFGHYLSEAGLAELDAMLTSGGYVLYVPEDAALLTVAWLVGAGDHDAARRLVDELLPFAGRLRFHPVPAEPETADPSVVFRSTAGDARHRLEQREPNPRVEAMREALTIWNPFADELLSHWLETVEDGRVAARFPAGWRDRGAALLARYEQLAAAHTRCTKHRKPKENLAILRGALADAVERGSPARPGLLQHAVDSMVRRRGAPGSPEHAALRRVQGAEAAQPAHHALARVVVQRLADLPPQRGIEDTGPLLAPVDGTAVPPAICAVVERALAGTPERLVERGVVRSAEVLAELVPRIAGTTVAAAYPDERLRALAAATYAAFRRRRSLLLLDLEHQVRIDELPWVRAVAPYKAGRAVGARQAVVRLAELALDAFPATLLPNRLVTELDALAREAGLELPFVEELAADIFMGRFSAKFPRAAQLAAQLLEGSLYARYYDLDRAADEDFGALCARRAGARPGTSVAANGAVIEQAQVLTTHNLATLAVAFGEEMTLDWARLAERGFHHVRRRRHDDLAAVKNLAYAWRQTIFHLSRLEPAEQLRIIRTVTVGPALQPALDGLRHVAEGGRFDARGRGGGGRRLLGWAADGRHWLLRTRSRA